MGAAGAATLLALTIADHASAEIYWTNETPGTIARANGDGTMVEPSFIIGATAPRGVAVGGGFVYWSHDGDPMDSGSIGRADLDGAAPNQSFVATAGPPNGIVVDSGSIYWTQIVSAAGKIGRATLGGAILTNSFVTTASAAPCGISSDADEVYWANGGTPGSIGSAHGSFTVNQSLVAATTDPCGVARAGDYIYWTNRGTDSIGRASLDGTDPQPSFIPLSAGAAPYGIAVDGDYIYWTTADDKIGRAPVSGLGHDVEADENFIATGVQDPRGIAVSPTLEVTPQSSMFADTEIGGASDIQAVLVSNTSSSVLDVNDVSLAGANPDDFEITGEGCSVRGVPAGIGCLFNVRFTPTAEGARSATLLISSSADGPPKEVTLTGKGAALPTGRPPDTKVDDAVASAQSTQKQRGGKIEVVVNAGAAEAVSLYASGSIKTAKSYELAPASNDAAAGETRTLTLQPLQERASEKIAGFLGRGKKAKAIVEVTLTDDAGNSEVKRLTVTLKGGKKRRK